jgi:hypothetical protein
MHEVRGFQLIAGQRDIRFAADYRKGLAVPCRGDFDTLSQLLSSIGITALGAKLHGEDDFPVLRGLDTPAGRVFQDAVLVQALGERYRRWQCLSMAQRDDDDRHEDNHEQRYRESRAFLPGHLSATSFPRPASSFNGLKTSWKIETAAIDE